MLSSKHADWRSASRDNYKEFRKKHKDIKGVDYKTWSGIIKGFNCKFRDYLLETGEKERLPRGFGEFSIIKKKRRHFIEYEGKLHNNLPIDWKKTKEKGKVIYNFNFHTEGYTFGWLWRKTTAMFKLSSYWYFKPCRISSRMINEYLRKDPKYQYLYQETNLKVR